MNNTTTKANDKIKIIAKKQNFKQDNTRCILSGKNIGFTSKVTDIDSMGDKLSAV